jgi:hypothetical protein
VGYSTNMDQYYAGPLFHSSLGYDENFENDDNEKSDFIKIFCYTQVQSIIIMTLNI